MRSIIFASLFASVLGCSGSHGGGVPSTPGAEPSEAKVDVARVDASSVPSAALPAAVAANNAFAADLYTRLVAAGSSQNIITSPVSASIALGMAYAGASGTTASQIAAALHFADATLIADGQNALGQALAQRGPAAASQAQAPTDGSVGDQELRVVNSIWGQRSYSWSTSFLGVLAASYGAGVYLEDFAGAPDQATSAINDWVKAQTDGAIYPLLQTLDPLTRMVLVNAVYLNLNWVSPFFSSQTQPGPFTRADGSQVTANLLNQTEPLAYTDDGQAQVVAIPLLGSIDAVITLPHLDVPLAAYEATLTATSAAITVPTGAQPVQLSLPKIDFTTPTFSLKSELQAMGMADAFVATQANFTAMCSAPTTCANLYIDDVEQKAQIAVQEYGVEAAAATAVVFEDSAGYGGPIPAMVVNRPYLIALVDQPTGAVLFLGHVEDPTAK
jgi:serpin B